jgi:hypothetical protein
VVIVLTILFVAIVVVLMALPRGRENAREASCQHNLAQIGKALGQYEQLQRSLPLVGPLAELDSQGAGAPRGPLRTLLETLQIPNLLVLKDEKAAPPPSPDEVPGEQPVAGFICASDPNATAAHFRAPVSYRAATGDEPAGLNGAFAPGGVLRLVQVDAGDGRSYTAAFSERLVGDTQQDHPALFNYLVVKPRLNSSGCPGGSADPSGWRGDAGSSWFMADYRSTLYNHSLAPGGQPSCLETSGQAAFMGASSGHLRGVHLLLLDGSVSTIRTTVDRKVWKELARIGPVEVADQ